MEHHGSIKSELCEFHHFPAKFAPHNCPKCCGTVLRRPQNWFTGVPARKKVLGGLLYCPKTPHNHYGTLPWGPQGTLDPAKANWEKIHRFPPQTDKSPRPPLQATRHPLASCRLIKDPNWGLEGLKCIKTSRKHHKYPPQSICKQIWNFFSGDFSPQIAQKQLSPQTRPLQATRHLLVSRRVIKDPNWGLQRPKCVKTIWKHHKYPPKVSPNTFGNFFFG